MLQNQHFQAQLTFAASHRQAEYLQASLLDGEYVLCSHGDAFQTQD